MSTLTGMLIDSLRTIPREPETESEAKDAILKAIKDVFKEWLRTVSLPLITAYSRDGVSFNATESIRKLLIALVDEP